MCTCISNIKPDATKALEAKYGALGTISDVALDSIGILQVGNTLVTQPILQCSYKLARFKKDGSEGRPAKQSLSITFSFCPFCGEKYEA